LKAIYGLYPDPDSAQSALNVLEQIKRESSLSDRDLVVLSGEPYEDYEFGQRDRQTPMPWLAVLGGLVGGLGGLWLVSFAQNNYPLVTGGMAIVPPYSLGIITYELAMLGAMLTTVFTLLVTAPIPEGRSGKLYDPEVSSGKILIGVINPPDAIRIRLLEALQAAGPGVVKEISEQSQAGGGKRLHFSMDNDR
jgi:hypothetical protein